MDWANLLSTERLRDSHYPSQPNRSIFVQDHDRIIFSAPFRRLANKTQVQPLYEHDHVHHRLIHSIEVSSVGRSLAMAVGHWLSDEGHIPKGTEHSLADIVQAACVAHDIGNPPFGHSGEAAIGAWFATLFDSNKGGLVADLDPALRDEFTAFEGNAQGFRILTRLEMYRNDGGMRLSKATLGAFTKYPALAATRQALPDHPYIGLKKFGVFHSEIALFAEAAETLGLPCERHETGCWWRRHPLVFLVEAADDICYNIVDLEDAFTTGELPFDIVRDLLEKLAGRPNRDVAGYSQAEHVALLRALGIGAAIRSAVAAFRENYDTIMTGRFSAPLVEQGDLGATFAEIRRMAGERIFTAPRKTALEISGRKIIANVLDGLLPVYEDLAAKGWQGDQLDSHCADLARALDLDLRDIANAEDALHALADFTSGMTDRYALRISRMLSGT